MFVNTDEVVFTLNRSPRQVWPHAEAGKRVSYQQVTTTTTFMYPFDAWREEIQNQVWFYEKEQMEFMKRLSRVLNLSTTAVVSDRYHVPLNAPRSVFTPDREGSHLPLLWEWSKKHFRDTHLRTNEPDWEFWHRSLRIDYWLTAEIRPPFPSMWSARDDEFDPAQHGIVDINYDDGRRGRYLINFDLVLKNPKELLLAALFGELNYVATLQFGSSGWWNGGKSDVPRPQKKWYTTFTE